MQPLERLLCVTCVSKTLAFSFGLTSSKSASSGNLAVADLLGAAGEQEQRSSSSSARECGGNVELTGSNDKRGRQ